METFRYIPTPEDRRHIDYLSLKVWQKAMSQPQKDRLVTIGRKAILPFIQKTLKRMQEIEAAADKPLSNRLSQEDNKIDAIWCVSAPGTWLRPWKEDRYKNTTYTRWWDRTQMLLSIKLSRLLNSSIVYNGRPDENEALRKAINDGGYLARVLEEKLYFIDTDKGKEFNLLDQVHNLRLPERSIQSGDGIGIVIRPGQAVRLLHFLNEPQNGFPKGVRVKIFPVKTGEQGLPYHHIQETCGLLYYRFTTGDAAENPYPYVV